jgi:hypothetical protein
VDNKRTLFPKHSSNGGFLDNYICFEQPSEDRKRAQDTQTKEGII